MRHHEAALVEALESCAAAVKQVAPRRWGFELANGRAFPVSARALDGWLVLEAAGPAVSKGEPWSLLERTGRIGGWSKFALAPGWREARLRAEIPLAEGIELRQRVQEACAGFREGLHPGVAPSSEPGEPRRDEALASWPTLLGEAGWSFTERADHLLVDLGVPGRWQQARLDERTGGGGRLCVTIAGSEATSTLARQALGLLLLCANATIRLARAAASGQSAGEAVFEVAFGTRPSAAELGCALSALSVACRLFGREARAVEHEDVAQRYLELQGWLS